MLNSPANLQKDGTQYDLPIALSILSVMDIIDKNSLKIQMLKIHSDTNYNNCTGNCFKGL
ncbi:magnesium chelatase domain-containing protein [Candidatus Gromoviella agglomerans]|uniref:magnesium chelatase domain-containing protein n=1 Tax=Candidatus Gromoviella agglomerans TaxID=2806609 RepID=UPI001E44CAD7|nr:magnesium chelatase domain-containing protein [Candidatus Gromoviella agglomerans]